MKESSQYRKELEKELRMAGGSLDTLFSKPMQSDKIVDNAKNWELDQSRILALASHKACLTLRELLGNGIVPRDMPAEHLVEFLDEYSKKLAKKNNQES